MVNKFVSIFALSLKMPYESGQWDIQYFSYDPFLNDDGVLIDLCVN